jgi:hypothetical protein
MLPPHLARHPLHNCFLEGIVRTDRQMAAPCAARRSRKNGIMKTTFQAGMLLKTKEREKTGVGFEENRPRSEVRNPQTAQR